MRRIDVYRDHAAVRRVLGGQQIEERSAARHELILRVWVVEECDERRTDVRPLRPIEIDEEETILLFGAARRADDRVQAVIAYRHVEQPIRVVRSLEDELILHLSLAYPMIEH